MHTRNMCMYKPISEEEKIQSNKSGEKLNKNVNNIYQFFHYETKKLSSRFVYFSSDRTLNYTLITKNYILSRKTGNKEPIKRKQELFIYIFVRFYVFWFIEISQRNYPLFYLFMCGCFFPLSCGYFEAFCALIVI